MSSSDNQPGPVDSYNLFTADPVLPTAVRREGGNTDLLTAFGAQVGSDEIREWARLANRNVPILHTHDRFGDRIDEVEYHPAYHSMLNLAVEAGIHCMRYEQPAGDGGYVTRNALMGLVTQIEMGHGCPTSMTSAALTTLRYQPELAEIWEPLILSRNYEHQLRAPQHKSGVLIGMGMTEKQGGSDVRRNTTKAIPNDDGSYSIIGHKFFFSAPMCDAHLILAQTEDGLSCFLLPRILENGQRNHVRIQRLKDKLGDWSNASSEVEFTGATGFLIGEEGRGVPVIIDMVSLTRLDCMIGSSALMRQGLVQAVHHVSEREAFGQRLIEQPLMKNVIADLTLECASHVALTMRVAKAVDAAENDNTEAAFARIATAIGKYWICKRTATFINEAQECLGGIGYVEENILPRLYRQAPLNSIWEGSGNVQCLDVLRAIAKDPQSKHALFQELTHARGKNRHYDNFVVELTLAFNQHEDIEVRSRLLTEKTALALQAAQLLKHGEGVLADAFCESRLSHQHGMAFGTLPAHVPFDDIIATGLVTPRQ